MHHQRQLGQRTPPFQKMMLPLLPLLDQFFFSIFGGVGIAFLPLGVIFSFIQHPKAVITCSQYIKVATELGKKARELKKATDALHQEERSGMGESGVKMFRLLKRARNVNIIEDNGGWSGLSVLRNFY